MEYFLNESSNSVVFKKHFLPAPGVLPKFFRERVRERRQAEREAVLAELWAFHGLSWKVSAFFCVHSGFLARFWLFKRLWSTNYMTTSSPLLWSHLIHELTYLWPKRCQYKPRPKSRSHRQRWTSFPPHLVYTFTSTPIITSMCSCSFSLLLNNTTRFLITVKSNTLSSMLDFLLNLLQNFILNNRVAWPKSFLAI